MEAVGAARRHSIRFVSGAPLSAAALAWQIDPPEDSRTVVVKGTFDVVQGGRATLRDLPDSLCGDVHEGAGAASELVYPSDFALFKPGADVTVRANAEPAGGPATSTTVQLSLGRGTRKLHRVAAVFGDRTWSGAKVEPSAPARFRRIPLSAGRAFGGPGFEPNPLGRGHGAPPPGVPHFLPNIEDPKALIKSPRDVPAPVLFGPVPPSFRARASKLGTYDERWLRSRWPYFPADFDWGYFRAAPPEQQMDYLEGDEPFELLGMSAARPAIHGYLPGLRVRCFAQQTAAAGGGFFEVVLRLDTVHFDVGAATGHLVWRGVVRVRDDDASDVAEMFLLAEPTARHPASLEAARAAYEAERARVAAEGAGDGFVEPEVADGPAPAAAPATTAPAPTPATAVDFANLPADIVARLAVMGIDAGAIANYRAPAVPPPAEPPGVETFVESLRKGGASEQDIAAMRASRSVRAGGGPDGAPAAAGAEAPPMGASPVPPPPGADAPPVVRAGALDGADLDDADLSGADLSNRSFRGASLRRARLAGCKLVGACFDEAQLGDADLTGADLTGASLERADLTGATLAGARLGGAALTDADLTRALARKASFERSQGARATFCEADLAGASFVEAHLPGADFTGAVIEGATFERAQLPDVRLFDASGKNARFAEAKMPGARGDGARLPGAALGSVAAPRSIWEGAVLDDATFYGADLRAAGFVRASCDRTTFSAADLTEARFTKASLVEAPMLKANLMKSTLEGANLTRADVRGANLHGAEVWKAVLEGARLDGAILTGTKLEGAK